MKHNERSASLQALRITNAHLFCRRAGKVGGIWPCSTRSKGCRARAEAQHGGNTPHTPSNAPSCSIPDRHKPRRHDQRNAPHRWRQEARPVQCKPNAEANKVLHWLASFNISRRVRPTHSQVPKSSARLSRCAPYCLHIQARALSRSDNR